MGRVRAVTWTIDIEQHVLRLGILGVPVRARQRKKSGLVETVLQFGDETGAEPGKIAREVRRQKHIEGWRDALGHGARHRRDHFLWRCEMLRQDGLER